MENENVYDEKMHVDDNIDEKSWPLLERAAKLLRGFEIFFEFNSPKVSSWLVYLNA